MKIQIDVRSETGEQTDKYNECIELTGKQAQWMGCMLIRAEDRMNEAFKLFEEIRVQDPELRYPDTVTLSMSSWKICSDTFKMIGSGHVGSHGCYEYVEYEYWISFEDIFDLWDEWKQKQSERKENKARMITKAKEEKLKNQQDLKAAEELREYERLKKKFSGLVT